MFIVLKQLRTLQRHIQTFGKGELTFWGPLDLSIFSISSDDQDQNLPKTFPFYHFCVSKGGPDTPAPLDPPPASEFLFLKKKKTK